MKWELKKFNELSGIQIFTYFRLRQEVFVVEQTCPYNDIDDTDLLASHLLTWEGNHLMACARIIPPGLSHNMASIGRIATSVNHRGRGLGRELVQRAIDHTQHLFPHQNIKIGAQERLKKFYQSFGFKTTSTVYLEDGIPHLDMKLTTTIKPTH